MNLYYVSLCLTFLLGSQRSGNELIPLEHSSSKIPVCITDECRRSAEMLRRTIDYGTHPCEDFYRFACGGFFNGDLTQLSDTRQLELNDKILGYLNSDEDYNIQAIAKIQHIFKLCMDEGAIEEFGDNVIQLQLNNIGLPSMPPFHTQTNIPINFSRILGKLHRNTAIRFLFSVDADEDPKDFRINRLFIHETRFLYNEVNRQKRYKYFKNYLIGAVKYLYQIEKINISDEILELVSGRVNELVQFLMSADKVAEENVFSSIKYEYITIQKLQEKTDKILRNTNIKFNWQEYLLQLFENMFGNDVESYFGSGEPLIVDNLKYLENIFEVISRIDADIFKASLWWVTVNDVTEIAYKNLRKLYKKFNKKIFGFMRSRKSTCLTFAQDKYSHALTHLLLQKVNLRNAKYEIYEMNENIKNSFIETIENASWMDELTREEAIRKLHNMETLISHEKWVENLQEVEKKYAGITVEYSWYETRLKENVRIFEEKLKLLFVRNKNRKREFPINLLDVTNIYSHKQNMVGIPFGAIEFPYFNHGLRSMDYGGLGVSLGYLFALTFNEEGRKIDSSGIERNWWKKSTLQKFNEQAKCFVDFYSKCNVNGREIELDGNRTLDSNIADNVGMKLALSAYEKYVHNYDAEEKLIGFESYSSEQLLTLAMASIMCLNIPQDSFSEIFENDVRSIYQLRVNGIFMNSDKMANIWGCSEGTPMNPKNKCYIW